MQFLLVCNMNKMNIINCHRLLGNAISVPSIISKLKFTILRKFNCFNRDMYRNITTHPAVPKICRQYVELL